MDTFAQVGAQWQAMLTTVATACERTSGFVRRRSKLTGAVFVQTVVLGWMANPHASVEELCQMAARRGVRISPQGLTQRFTPAAATLLRQVLEAAMGEVVAAAPVAVAVLRRFTAVFVVDSTTISLPAALAHVWAGCGGGQAPGQGTAALKVQVCWDLVRGALSGLELQDGRAQDRRAALQRQPLPSGALRLADVGYFSLAVLAQITAAGAYWVTRLQAGTRVCGPSGQPLDLPRYLAAACPTVDDALDQPVRVGAAARLPARLLAVRVPQEVAERRRAALQTEARRQGQPVSRARLALADWTLLITNVPVDRLSGEEARVLLRVRWQIELLFKLWKGQGAVDEWRSAQPWRILCEVYAKLLAQLLQHWLLVAGCWEYPDRSLPKAAHTLQQQIGHIATVLDRLPRLLEAFAVLDCCWAAGCRLTKRKTAPSTFQRLQAFDQPGLG